MKKKIRFKMKLPFYLALLPLIILQTDMLSAYDLLRSSSHISPMLVNAGHLSSRAMLQSTNEAVPASSLDLPNSPVGLDEFPKWIPKKVLKMKSPYLAIICRALYTGNPEKAAPE